MMRFGWLLLGFLFLPHALASAATEAGAPSAIFQDPPADPAYPAAGLGVQFMSQGQVMNGMMYQAAGRGPHPVAVLLHGLPGNEQNLDLAQAMRRAGWTVITYHYRGSWGSQGRFSIDGVILDADAVLDRLRDPATAAAWRVDPKRMVIIGHSLGGLAAAHAGAHAPDLLGTALIAPFDPSALAPQYRALDPAARDQAAAKRFGDSDGRLTGAVSADIGELIARSGEQWRLADDAEGLAGRPLFIAVAARDNDSNKVLGLAPALKAQGARQVTLVQMDTDHSFNDHRIALETAILRWLATLPGAPALR
jgi:pimeloyl-ACP methyl ester carboxylesterase